MANTVRYWDGTAWTEHRAPAGQAGSPTEAPAPVATPTPDKKPDNTTKGCLGCLGLVAVAVAFVFIASLIGSDDDDGGGEFGARGVCEQFVKERLKAPATADFSDTEATSNGGESRTVSGSVDSENGFGALIRNTYSCTVHHTTGDNWRLDDMQFSGN
jgi:hypothetical protein